MTNATRERASDEAAGPTLWYVYILRFDDGGFYIGQTNNLETRLAEHALGGGAQETAGRPSKPVWFTHTHDRENAKRIETRLQAALARSDAEIQAIVDSFDRLIGLIRPAKTLRELEAEDQKHQAELHLHYHLFVVRKSGHPAAPWNQSQHTACGGEIPFVSMVNNPHGYGTTGVEVFTQRAREEDALASVGGKPPNRPICRPCLSVAHKYLEHRRSQDDAG